MQFGLLFFSFLLSFFFTPGRFYVSCFFLFFVRVSFWVQRKIWRPWVMQTTREVKIRARSHGKNACKAKGGNVGWLCLFAPSCSE